jgi:hypothetical protein
MSKSDSFFIRATQNINKDNSYQEGQIDLGAYVDALGKSVLRIHNIQITYSDATGRSSTLTATGGTVAQWQLLTQSQTDIVLPSNKSLISSGRVHMNAITAPGLASEVTDVNDINLHEWTNGYLVAVDTLYFGGSASANFAGNVYVSIVMECTVETMTQAGAMALALSQQ